MNLEISSLDLIYSNLRQIDEDFKTRGTIGVPAERESGSGLAFPGFSFRANSVELPSPLKSVAFYLNSRGGIYSAGVVVAALSERFFDGLSEQFQKKFAPISGQSDNSKYDNALEWLPVDAKGTGYLVRGDTPVLSIARLSGDSSLGQNGRDLMYRRFWLSVKKNR